MLYACKCAQATCCYSYEQVNISYSTFFVAGYLVVRALKVTILFRRGLRLLSLDMCCASEPLLPCSKRKNANNLVELIQKNYF